MQITDDEKALLWEAAQIYREMQRFPEALDVLAGLAALYPDQDEIETAIGTVYFQAGSLDEAQTHYQRALQLNPRNARTEALLGELYLLGYQDSARAVSHFQTAQQLDPAASLADAYLQLVAAYQLA